MKLAPGFVVGTSRAAIDTKNFRQRESKIPDSWFVRYLGEELPPM
jgi:hypothetical protein